MLWQVIGLVFVAGCIGGFVNALLAGELELPRYRKECATLYLGWVGNALIGGVAALVFWGLYGPLAKATILGSVAATASSVEPTLAVGEMCGSLIAGLGGGQLLPTLVDNRCLNIRVKNGE